MLAAAAAKKEAAGAAVVPWRAYLNFGLTYVGYGCLLACRKPFSAAKPSLEDEMGFSTASLGAIDASMLTFYSLGSLVVGPYLAACDIPKPWLLGLSMIASGLCCALVGLASSWPIVLCAWSLNGLFQSWAYSQFLALLSPWLPHERRGALMGVWNSCCSAGNFCSSVLTYKLLETHGWRRVFTVPGTVLVGVGTSCCLLLSERSVARKWEEREAAAKKRKEEKDASSEDEDEAPTPPTSPKKVSSPAAAASSAHSPQQRPSRDVGSSMGGGGGGGGGGGKPGIRLWGLVYVPNLAVGYALIKPIRYTLSFWLPYYLRKQLLYNEADIAAVLMAHDGANLCGGMLFSVLLDSLFLGQLFVPLSVGLAALLALLSTLAEASVLLNAVIVCIGTVFSGLELIGSGATAGCVTEHVGGSQATTLPSIIAVINGSGSLGAMVAILFVSSLVDAIGWRGLFNALACCALGAAAILVPTMTRPSRPRSPSGEAVSPSQSSGKAKTD